MRQSESSRSSLNDYENDLSLPAVCNVLAARLSDARVVNVGRESAEITTFHEFPMPSRFCRGER